MNSELVTVAELLTSTEAALVSQRLADAGIRVYLENTQVSEMFGEINALGGARILVEANDGPLAKTLLAKWAAETQISKPLADETGETERWICRRCGADSTEDVDTCGVCGASRDGTLPVQTTPDANALDPAESEATRETRHSIALGALSGYALGGLIILVALLQDEPAPALVVIGLALWFVGTVLWPRD